MLDTKTDHGYAVMSRFLELLVPKNGRAMFVVESYEAYFDESGTHEGSPIMCAIFSTNRRRS